MHPGSGMHTRTRRETIATGGMTLVLGLGLMYGCASSPLEAEIPREVKDKTTAEEKFGDVIVNEVAGVKVEASVDDWDGDREVFEHVTPVRLEIENGSGMQLRVSFEDIELQAADGSTYQALPLYRISGTVTKPVVVADWDYSPTYQEGFFVAPYAAPFYEGDYMIYEGHYDYDPGYYDTYYRYWAELPLPTSYMIERSLPEGVMAEQGRVEGWVYFEKVPRDEDLEPVYLSVALVKAESGERIGRIRLPFEID